MHDYNLQSSSQLGVMLLNIKYGYKIDTDVLRTIISKTHEFDLNINHNYAMYVKHVIEDENIPEEMVTYWEKMQYSDLLSLAYKSKFEKCNLKLTVM